MSRAERNWELTLPSRRAVPPFILPRTTRGAFPLLRMEKAWAPRSLRLLKSGPLGRLRMEASPVRTAPSVRAATAEQKRKVVPELRTSITSSGVRGRSATPLIFTSSSISISAPKAWLAEMVALVSADRRGRLMLPPGPREVMRMARWV